MFKKLEKQKIIIFVIIGIIIVLSFIKMIDNNYQTNNNIEINNSVIADKVEETDTEEKIVVYITGEVNAEGVIELENGSRIADAIEKAGGLTEEANIKNVNLAYELEDGQKIYIPNINEQTIITENSNEIIEDSDENKQMININKANTDELETLNGIGKGLSKSIIEYREENGKFDKIEDLMNVPGIGESKFNNIKDRIKVK